MNRQKIYQEPIVYVDDHNIIFIDDGGKYFHWDETSSYAYGPYKTEVEVRYELWRYNMYLECGENQTPPPFASIKPLLLTICSLDLEELRAAE